jgi:hypothetical protein
MNWILIYWLVTLPDGLHVATDHLSSKARPPAQVPRTRFTQRQSAPKLVHSLTQSASLPEINAIEAARPRKSSVSFGADGRMVRSVTGRKTSLRATGAKPVLRNRHAVPA